MRAHETVRMLVGGAAFYVAMAACSGSPAPSGEATRGGGHGGAAGGAIDSGAGGSAEESGVNLGVPEAAAAVPPDVAIEPCDKTVDMIAGVPVKYAYAEHAFPGRTVTDLAGLRVMAHTTTNSRPVGYEFQQTLAHLADGSARVLCGTTDALTFDSVTFVLPAP